MSSNMVPTKGALAVDGLDEVSEVRTVKVVDSSLWRIDIAPFIVLYLAIAVTALSFASSFQWCEHPAAWMHPMRLAKPRLSSCSVAWRSGAEFLPCIMHDA